ncbi:hypothetical protein GQ42DRAFT_115934, partial [Ramicandelaber brevisporus]
RNYKRQFAHMYYYRLAALKPIVLANCREYWREVLSSPNQDQPPQATYIPKVLNVPTMKPCFIIGTVYREMAKKPNVIDDLKTNLHVQMPPKLDKYTGQDDELTLEDESGRITLSGDVLENKLLVTGVIAGFLGVESDSTFEVLEVCFADLPGQDNDNIASNSGFDMSAKYVLLMSGLNIGSSTAKSALWLQTLTTFICGSNGTLGALDQLSSRIVKVIVAGNSVNIPAVPDGTDKTDIDQALDTLDETLSQWASVTSVDLMPGATDPSTVTLPQQQLHSALLPRASLARDFRCITNPQHLDIDGVQLLGVAGQTVDDIVKSCDVASRLVAAEHTLLWRHLSPTSPDTLLSFPYADSDPFVLEADKCPHIYFVGNQPEFATSIMRQHNPSPREDMEKESVVRVVMVPSFAETGTVALVNLTTLQAHPFKFN